MNEQVIDAVAIKGKVEASFPGWRACVDDDRSSPRVGIAIQRFRDGRPERHGFYALRDGFSQKTVENVIEALKWARRT